MQAAQEAHVDGAVTVYHARYGVQTPNVDATEGDTVANEVELTRFANEAAAWQSRV